MKKLILLGILILFDIFVPIIMNFLTVEMSSYINYLTWINALVVFYLFLPKNVSSSNFL